MPKAPAYPVKTHGNALSQVILLDANVLGYAVDAALTGGRASA
jgi:hypothetical protein